MLCTIRNDLKEYKKYLDDITELALNSEKFSMEIKRVNKE